jgi:hypothetical protein
MTTHPQWWTSDYINDANNILYHTTWSLGIEKVDSIEKGSFAKLTIQKFGNKNQVDSYDHDLSYLMAESVSGTFLNKIQTTVNVDKDEKYMVLNTQTGCPKVYIGMFKTGHAVVLARMITHDNVDRGLVWLIVNTMSPGVKCSLFENCHMIQDLIVSKIEFNNVRLDYDESLLKGSIEVKTPYLLLSTTRHMFRSRYDKWRSICNIMRLKSTSDNLSSFHSAVLKICIVDMIKDCISELEELSGAATMFTDFTIPHSDTDTVVSFNGDNSLQYIDIYRKYRDKQGWQNRLLRKMMHLMDSRDITARSKSYVWRWLYDILEPKDSYIEEYLKSKIYMI